MGHHDGADSAIYDQSARVWDVATAREILRLSGHTDGLWSVAFSPDGTKIVTSSRDKTARIWDAQTGRELIQLSGHTEWVTSAAFSPDGRRLVTGSFDTTAMIWDAGSGRKLLKLTGHSDRRFGESSGTGGSYGRSRSE